MQASFRSPPALVASPEVVDALGVLLRIYHTNLRCRRPHGYATDSPAHVRSCSRIQHMEVSRLGPHLRVGALCENMLSKEGIARG